MAALFARKVSVSWIWWFTALFSSAILALAVLILPPDEVHPSLAQVKAFDYVGTALLVAALGLFNFTWNQAPITGWSESYVWALLLVSVLTFVAFYFWERSVGSKALIPTAVLQRTSLLVYLSLWLGWMSFGIYLYYTAQLWVTSLAKLF